MYEILLYDLTHKVYIVLARNPSLIGSRKVSGSDIYRHPTTTEPDSKPSIYQSSQRKGNHTQNEAPHPQLPLLRPQDLQDKPSRLPPPPQRGRTRESRSRDQPTAHSEYAAQTQLGRPEDDFTRGKEKIRNQKSPVNLVAVIFLYCSTSTSD